MHCHSHKGLYCSSGEGCSDVLLPFKNIWLRFCRIRVQGCTAVETVQSLQLRMSSGSENKFLHLFVFKAFSVCYNCRAVSDESVLWYFLFLTYYINTCRRNYQKYRDCSPSLWSWFISIIFFVCKVFFLLFTVNVICRLWYYKCLNTMLIY